MSDDSDLDDNNKRGPPPVAAAARVRRKPRAMWQDVGQTQSTQDELDKEKYINEQLKLEIAAMKKAEVDRIAAEKANEDYLLKNPDGLDET